MTQKSNVIVLGSRSPRRRGLLEYIVPAERVEVVPPRSTDEAGFDGLDTWPALETRLLTIARRKCNDVREQLGNRFLANDGDSDVDAVVAADTTIVVSDADDRLIGLGQPPPDDSWKDTARKWFTDFYAGRTHTAVTALCVATPSGRRAERVVKSHVAFRRDVVERWLDWYLETGESVGKAGGYAIQGAADLFVERVEGSISNVVGLPLRDLVEMFEELDINVWRQE